MRVPPALTPFVFALVFATAARAAPVVSSITVGGDDRGLQIDVDASGPLGYLLSEGAEPFTLSLLFAGASFGFPDAHRTFSGIGLAELEARTLTREGTTLAKLDLTFARAAPYTVVREGSRVRLRAEVPGPTPAVVIGTPGEPAPAAALRTAPAELRAVQPESSATSARLVLDIDGMAAFTTFTMSGPARVVVDLEKARVEKSSSIEVRGGLLRGVRISQHTKTVVRIVCDLSRPAPFAVESVARGLIIHLGEGVR